VDHGHPQTADGESQRHRRGGRGQRAGHTGQHPTPSPQGPQPEGHQGDDDAFGVDQAEHEGTGEEGEQKGGAVGRRRPRVLAHEEPDGHHGGEPVTLDSTAPVNRSEAPLRWARTRMANGKTGKKAMVVPGDVPVHGDEMLGPAVRRRPEKPTAVPAVDGPGDERWAIGAATAIAAMVIRREIT